MDVHVFVEAWEIECCQPPPAEGDRVAWPLLWVADTSGPGVLEVAWEIRPLPPGPRPDDGGLHLVHGPLSAWWRGTVPEEVPAHGRLLVDAHGGVPEQVPRTAGTVHSVRVVEQAFHQTAPRTYEPIAGAFVLRPVAHGPERFADDRTFDEGPLPEVVRVESGVLVGVALEGTTS